MRSTSRNPQLDAMLEELVRAGPDGPPMAQKLEMVAFLRSHSPETAARLDRFLLEHIERLRSGLNATEETQNKLRALMEKLTAPAWHPALLLGVSETDFGPAAMVLDGHARLVVGIHEELDPEVLQVGDEVLLTGERNLIMAKSPFGNGRCGETAVFDRYTADGRLVLRHREEEILAHPSAALRQVALRQGDEVRFDRAAWLAFEKIERSQDSSFFLEETPRESFQDIGGLDQQIEELQRSIRLHLYHAELVKKYRLPRKKSVLLYGPPGTGKTLMARALANWLAQLSGSGRSRFMNIKPAALHSMWYGQSEANYREVFRIAREAGERDPEIPVVMFFDEIDAVGATRGHSWHRVDDRVLNAFMAELNGLEERGNVLVVGATNRLDVLDPALLRPGRLGDLQIRIPRPNRRAARDIFFKHLPADAPYAVDSRDAAGAREYVVEAALARLYASDSESELATITFRDGKRRTVRASDLINGAAIAGMAQTAAERACWREAQTGRGGITPEDLLEAVAEYFQTAAARLTPHNCREHLEDLPQDLDVVRVEPRIRRVARPHSFLNVA